MTAGHVTAVTDAMIPQRAAAIAGCEQPLVDLALEARPCEVKTAVGRIRDLADPDGSDTQPLSGCGPDARRYLEVCPTIDGLVQGRFLLDQVEGEALLTALEAADTPDPPDTPLHQRRCHGQRRADALSRFIHSALASGGLPEVPASKPQVLLTVDLATLIGAPDGRAGRLRFTGDLPADRARHLALRAAVTVVLMMGPWRVVNVGRRFRTLPAWLRVLWTGCTATAAVPTVTGPSSGRRRITNRRGWTRGRPTSTPRSRCARPTMTWSPWAGGPHGSTPTPAPSPGPTPTPPSTYPPPRRAGQLWPLCAEAGA